MNLGSSTKKRSKHPTSSSKGTKASKEASKTKKTKNKTTKAGASYVDTSSAHVEEEDAEEEEEPEEEEDDGESKTPVKKGRRSTEQILADEAEAHRQEMAKRKTTAYDMDADGADDEHADLEAQADETGTIAERRARKSKVQRAHGRRAKERAAAGTSVKYGVAKQKGMWNEKTRPGFLDGTKKAVWEKAGADTDSSGDPTFQCPGCGGTFSYDELSIDHVKDWKTWVLEHADMDGSRYTQASVNREYSNIDNLQAMCQPCNSSKNGPKGRYD